MAPVKGWGSRRLGAASAALTRPFPPLAPKLEGPLLRNRSGREDRCIVGMLARAVQALVVWHSSNIHAGFPAELKLLEGTPLWLNPSSPLASPYMYFFLTLAASSVCPLCVPLPAPSCSFSDKCLDTGISFSLAIYPICAEGCLAR